MCWPGWCCCFQQLLGTHSWRVRLDCTKRQSPCEILESCKELPEQLQRVCRCVGSDGWCCALLNPAQTHGGHGEGVS